MGKNNAQSIDRELAPKKHIVRLKVKELMKAQIDEEIKSDAELAHKMGVSVSQVWRAKLGRDDERRNNPGAQFIAGILAVFKGHFEDFFYIEEVIDC